MSKNRRNKEYKIKDTTEQHNNRTQWSKQSKNPSNAH